jgi:hypothetical protein
MTDSDALEMPDGRDLIRTMGWIPLPYSCVGLARQTNVGGRNTVWSWLILVPWASDSKPWLDGTKVLPASALTEDEEREEVLAYMRELLDDRYGEAVGNSAVEDFIRRIQEDE